MQHITLSGVCPEVFRDQALQSQVWRTELTLLRGERYLIEASSGAGKSSLCSYLYGWRGDYEGTIAFDGADLRTFKASRWTELRQHSLSFLVQDMRLFEELTAWENVQLKNQLTGYHSPERIRQLFVLLGIEDSPARLLSLGQQQRVALIRCLCQPYDFLLLDEPISHLDEANALTLASLITEEANQQGAGIIVTSVGKQLPLDYDQTLQL